MPANYVYIAHKGTHKQDSYNMAKRPPQTHHRSTCKKPVVLSDEMYWWLVKRKFELRAHSIDEVLRMDLQDLPESLRGRTSPQVKLYEWERWFPAMTDENPEPVRMPTQCETVSNSFG